jgi:hypothetical protein
VLSQAKGARGPVVFEVRVGRKLAGRSGMLMSGVTKMSSRQEESSTMNCSGSEGRCRDVVVFVSVGRRNAEAVVASCASTPCAYQQGLGRDSQTLLSSDPPGA